VSSGAAYVKIPAPKRGVDPVFGGIMPDGGRGEEPSETAAQPVLSEHLGWVWHGGNQVMKAYSGIYLRMRGVGMNRTMKFGMVITVVIGTLTWLAIGGTNESASYYKTIAELDKMGQSAKDKKLRVGGFVEAGSIKRSGNQVDFVLIEEDRKMKVSYAGNEPLPDTFKDGSQALIDGRMGDGVFHASKIAAKCASKYEAKPGQNYKGNASTYEKKS
jgi:cytochrome c-type biogenesis protein CcmE